MIGNNQNRVYSLGLAVALLILTAVLVGVLVVGSAHAATDDGIEDVDLVNESYDTQISHGDTIHVDIEFVADGSATLNLIQEEDGWVVTTDPDGEVFNETTQQGDFIAEQTVSASPDENETVWKTVEIPQYEFESASGETWHIDDFSTMNVSVELETEFPESIGETSVSVEDSPLFSFDGFDDLDETHLLLALAVLLLGLGFVVMARPNGGGRHGR